MKKVTLVLGLAIVLLGTLFSEAAENYAVILSDSKVYEEPNARGYVAKNMADEDVSVSKDMVFKVLEKTNGWDIIEYSPGIRGYIMDTVTASGDDLSMPMAGGFNPINNPKEVVNISSADGVWTLSANGHNFKGIESNKAVVFVSESGHIAYSLVVMNGKTFVYDYENNLTRFF